MRKPGERWPRWSMLLDLLANEDGRPPCDPPDACAVCRLLERPQPGETWTDWYRRVSQDR